MGKRFHRNGCHRRDQWVGGSPIITTVRGPSRLSLLSQFRRPALSGCKQNRQAVNLSAFRRPEPFAPLDATQRSHFMSESVELSRSTLRQLSAANAGGYLGTAVNVLNTALRPISWTVSSTQPNPINAGWLTSPTSGRLRAGCMWRWRWCWTCTHDTRWARP